MKAKASRSPRPRRIGAWKFARILVPVDLSECSTDVVPSAMDLAEHLGGEIILLHVIEPMACHAVGVASLVGADLISDEQRQVRKKLERLAEVSQVPAHPLVRMGRPWVEICNVAQQEGCNLIMMSRHGATGLARTLLGSVAEKVTRHAPCAVMTLMTKGGRNRMRARPGATQAGVGASSLPRR
jgi:nucleotide-binding universal stress UspA family protein